MSVKKSVSDRRRARLARRVTPPGEPSLAPGGASELPSGLAGDVSGMEDLLTEAPEAPAPAAAGESAPPATPPAVPLRGAMKGASTIPDQREGESFNSFRKRALGAVQGLMSTLASRPAPVVVTVGPSVASLVSAWTASGTPDDFSIDHSALSAPASGGLMSLQPSASGEWALAPVDAVTGPGLYLVVRDTPEARGASDRTGALGALVEAVRARDFVKAKDLAARASASGVSDDDISDAIDDALPDENDASSLSPAELIAAVSAAGPEKRSRLAPVLQSLIGSQSDFLSGEGRHPLRSHLGRLGIR